MCHRITLSHTHTSCMDAEFSGGSSPHMKSRRRVNLLQGEPRIPCKARRSSFERPLPAGVGSVTNGDRRVSIVHQTQPWAESQRGRNRETPATHAVNTPPLSFLAAAAAAAQGAEALTLVRVWVSSTMDPVTASNLPKRWTVRAPCLNMVWTPR